MKQFLHRKATLSKVLLVIRHTAASTGQLRADSEARSSKNCQSSGSAIGPSEVCSRADGLSLHSWPPVAHCLKISRAKTAARPANTDPAVTGTFKLSVEAKF